MKRCPFCAEEIQDEAIKCRYCGENLDQGRGRPPELERVVWVGHPSWLNYGVAMIIGIVLIPFGGLGVVIILLAIWARQSHKYTITTHKLISQNGILSRSHDQIDMGDLKYVGVKRRWTDLMTGSVLFGSSGTAGIEVTFWGLSKPIKVKEIVDRLRR